jgi:hypothetical protein
MQQALLRRVEDGLTLIPPSGLNDHPPFSRLFVVCGKAANVSD